MGALGLRKVSLLVIGRGRLPRHAAGGLLGFRVLIVAVLCGSICTVACQPVHVCRIGVSVREHVVVRGWREDSTWGEAIRACSPPVREGRWLQFFLVCFFLGRVFAATIHCYVWGCQVGFSEQGSGDRVSCGEGHITTVLKGTQLIRSFGLCFAPAWVIAAPSLRCSMGVAPIGAHLPSICCDPAGILPSTSGFPVVGVLVGLYASLQCCHQPINPPPGACRRAPKQLTTLQLLSSFTLLERSRICDVPDPCAPGPQQGVGRPM